MKIAFQTLACPDWSWEKVISEANRLGYDGIEIRGIEGELYLPKARPFLLENRGETRRQLADHGLEICCLDTSCAFHAPEKYDSAIQEGRAAIDLAAELDVPFIRVFGDLLPGGIPEKNVLSRVSGGLDELGDYAESGGVTVLLETHGDFNNHDLLAAVMAQTSSSAIGILWDFEHPFMNGEAPETTYSHLGKYIKHTHVKDARRVGNEKVLCMIGDGEVPVPKIVDILQQGGYKGWLSLEFEKLWKPYLEEPEIALPAFIRYIKEVREKSTFSLIG